MPETPRKSSDLPKYLCHKTVQALKIRSVEPGTEPTLIPGGSWILTPEEPGHAALEVSHDWVLKNKPQAGGYFVLYEDGYTSYSPASAFESGYAKISDSFQERVVAEKAELDARLEKLIAFIGCHPISLGTSSKRTAAFESLTYENQELLEKQLSLMWTLSDVLEDRIALFAPSAVVYKGTSVGTSEVSAHPIDASKLLRSAGYEVRS